MDKSTPKIMTGILQGLEPVFIKAGELACQRQKKAVSRRKTTTGVSEVDVVSEADLEVQEYILGAMVKTKLRQCRLLAEEDTPLAKTFNEDSGLFLTVDPINGTSLYVDQKPYFNIVICLHNAKTIFYTFSYYPAISWLHIIVGLEHKCQGPAPNVELAIESSKVIVYAYGAPLANVRKLYNKLVEQGYEFHQKYDISRDIGATTLFLGGRVAGLYCENPIVYDALVGLHYAQSQGYEVYAGSGDGELDLSKIVKGKLGLYHPGYYLALAKYEKLR